MNPALKLLLIFGLVLAVGGGAWALFGNDGAAPSGPTNPAANAGAEDPAGQPETPELLAGDPNAAKGPSQPARTEVNGSELVGSGDQFEQGVTGRIIDPMGVPVVGAEIMLVVSPHSDIMTAITRHQKGIKDVPVAIGESSATGEFAVGVAAPGGKVYDVWILHPRWSDHQLRGIRIQDADWYDTKDVTLQPGAVVYGNVTDELTGAAVAEARVLIQSNSQLNNMVSLPGREDGIYAYTDANGFYRVENAPAGLANLSVDDPRYARVVQAGVNLAQEQETRQDFSMALGYTIAGIVVDEAAQPVSGATVRAVSLSVKQPQSETAVTDSRGQFQIPGLRDGAFQVSVEAKNYQPFKESPILSATADSLELVVERKNGLGVRVTADNNQRINNYRLRVLRWFPANNTMGLAPDIPPQRIRASDLDNGIARVDGINFGHYVLEVQAAKFAKSFSEPFELKPGMDDPIVDVVVNAGATLVGQVMDSAGKPVVGATISTETDGQIDLGEDGLGAIFGGLVKAAPKRIATVEAKTNAQGTYQIDNLPYGAYQLRATHPEYVGGVQSGIQLDGPGQFTAPVLTLDKGCVVSGLAGVNGVPIGQVKVRISTPAPQPVPGQPQVAMTNEEMQKRFSTTAVTLNDGTWRFLKRVPPGTYEIMAERMTAGPFEKIMDHRTSKQTVTVVPGQEQAQFNLNIQLSR